MVPPASHRSSRLGRVPPTSQRSSRVDRGRLSLEVEPVSLVAGTHTDRRSSRARRGGLERPCDLSERNGASDAATTDDHHKVPIAARSEDESTIPQLRPYEDRPYRGHVASGTRVRPYFEHLHPFTRHTATQFV